MTNEEKELLLNALCGYLPYGVMCDRLGHPKKLLGVHPNKKHPLEFDNGEYMPKDYDLEEIKPYLRPMSSMTEEEEIGYDATFDTIYVNGHYDSVMTYKSFDWLNAHYFDYRGLIEKGLALPAQEGMYK